MRSAGLRFSILFTLLMGAGSGVNFAAEEPWADQLTREFEGLKTRLADAEQTNQDILAQKDEIIEETKRLRIWVRHSGG